MNRLMKERKTIIFYVVLFTLCVAFASAQGVKKIQKPKLFDILSKFYAAGWMGDGEQGTKYIKLFEAWRQNPHSDPICVKITYTPGETGWAGIYWQNKPNNWGKKPGNNFQNAGYKKLTFWAKGEKGDEIVEFKAGGIDNTSEETEEKIKFKYKDSFEVTAGKIALEKEWKQYTIDLKVEDLSSVIGGFCWVASSTANPGAITFYIDDVYYE